MVARLTGVDLSARMIDKARSLGVYDRLEHGDIVEFLAASEERFDLVLAADVFIYVGDLEPVFARLERAMAEACSASRSKSLEGGGDGLRLLPSLRYAHSKAYLERLASQHGFEVVAMKARAGAGGPRRGGRGALRAPAQSARPGRPQAPESNRCNPLTQGGAFIARDGQTAHDRPPFPVSTG